MREWIGSKVPRQHGGSRFQVRSRPEHVLVVASHVIQPVVCRPMSASGVPELLAQRRVTSQAPQGESERVILVEDVESNGDGCGSAKFQ